MSSTADVLAIVLFVFFAVGVAVGIVTVIALSARRADKADRQSGRRPSLARTPAISMTTSQRRSLRGGRAATTTDLRAGRGLSLGGSKLSM